MRGPRRGQARRAIAEGHEVSEPAEAIVSVSGPGCSATCTCVATLAARDLQPRVAELLTAQRAVQAHGGRVWFEDAGRCGWAVWLSIRDPGR